MDFDDYGCGDDNCSVGDNMSVGSLAKPAEPKYSNNGNNYASSKKKRSKNGTGASSKFDDFYASSSDREAADTDDDSSVDSTSPTVVVRKRSVVIQYTKILMLFLLIVSAAILTIGTFYIAGNPSNDSNSSTKKEVRISSSGGTRGGVANSTANATTTNGLINVANATFNSTTSNTSIFTDDDANAENATDATTPAQPQVLATNTTSAGPKQQQQQRDDSDDDNSNNNNATVDAFVVILIFIVLIAVFLRYDYLVSRRNSLVLDMAKRSRQIVDSLFPSMVRDRLLQQNSSHEFSSHGGGGSNHASSQRSNDDPIDFKELTKRNTEMNKNVSEFAPIPISQLATQQKPQLNVSSYLSSSAEGKAKLYDNAASSQPIADLFPNTTVFFADIAGFTAWSADRDPPQVFTLLETLYGQLDALAKSFNVFKVETIGDSYMAVTGLPDPMPDHAVAMAKFAYQSLQKMQTIVTELEPVLGPGTAALDLRIGMHSGPVTAGVLRGQKSRFQLFGDTVNTASRMESTGVAGKIQVSSATAEQLIQAGKQHWLVQREQTVLAKGKGELCTFFLQGGKQRKTQQQQQLQQQSVPPQKQNGGNHTSELEADMEEDDTQTPRQQHGRFDDSDMDDEYDDDVGGNLSDAEFPFKTPIIAIKKKRNKKSQNETAASNPMGNATQENVGRIVQVTSHGSVSEMDNTITSYSSSSDNMSPLRRQHLPNSPPPPPNSVAESRVGSVTNRPQFHASSSIAEDTRATQSSETPGTTNVIVESFSPDAYNNKRSSPMTTKGRVLASSNLASKLNASLQNLGFVHNPSSPTQSAHPEQQRMHSKPSPQHNSLVNKRNERMARRDENIRGETLEQRNKRLIDWSTNVLMKHLQAVMANHHADGAGNRVAGAAATVGININRSKSVKEIDHSKEQNEIIPAFDTVAEVIIFPQFDPYSFKKEREQKEHRLAALPDIKHDLKRYVSEIAAMYNDVPFHNFEHASHVTLATNKLVSRIAGKDKAKGESDTIEDHLELYVRTFGLSTDALTHFALVLAALVHDVGHLGVPNSQLVAENADVAVRYNGKSVAEQNSVRLAWQLLMEPRYQRLRAAIYKTNTERKRFRQVLANAVMATDIADREVIVTRSKKWERAFQTPYDLDQTSVDNMRGSKHASWTRDEMNRKATVVIETLIQVADVAHTMQHWDIYRRWNECLFEEMNLAFRNGRASFDPVSTWYKGEIGFFDHYVIPLANKVKECAIFGPTGEPYVSNAVANRDAWEKKGLEEIRAMVESIGIIQRTDPN